MFASVLVLAQLNASLHTLYICLPYREWELRHLVPGDCFHCAWLRVHISRVSGRVHKQKLGVSIFESLLWVLPVCNPGHYHPEPLWNPVSHWHWAVCETLTRLPWCWMVLSADWEHENGKLRHHHYSSKSSLLSSFFLLYFTLQSFQVVILYVSRVSSCYLHEGWSDTLLSSSWSGVPCAVVFQLAGASHCKDTPPVYWPYVDGYLNYFPYLLLG